MPLVTDDERRQLQLAVGSRQTVVASAVARLYLSSPDPKAKKNDPNSVLRSFKNLSEEKWTNSNVQGALVFVIDRSTDSFVFQIYDLSSFKVRFEYELYFDMEYSMLSGQFHAFEMEDCVAGFCFADGAEARSFITKVMALKPSTKQTGGNLLKPQKEKKGGFFGGFFGGAGSKKKRGNDDDDDDIKIGEIRMIQHNQHVGVNADGTFDLQNLPSHWKAMFKEAGIKKKDLLNPETAGMIMQTIQQAEAQQELAEIYKNDQEYEDMGEDEIEEAVGEFTEEELAAYQKYQDELRAYYEELEAYEAEQAALEAWEKDNAAKVEEERKQQERERARKAAAAAKAAEAERSAPPPLPPRKLQEAAKQAESDAKQAQKQLQVAEKQFRASVRRFEKSPEQLELERAREEARVAAEKARQAAEEAAAERDAILRELEEAKAARKAVAAAASPKPSRMSLSLRKSKSRDSVPPPLPDLPPPILDVPPPPPPPPLPELPAAPKLPELPKLPRPSLSELKDVKLNKAPAKPRPPQNTLMKKIQGGVELKKAPKRTPSKALPDLKQMKPKAQNQLMANLISKMQERRGQLGEASDDEDDWD